MSRGGDCEDERGVGREQERERWSTEHDDGGVGSGGLGARVCGCRYASVLSARYTAVAAAQHTAQQARREQRQLRPRSSFLHAGAREMPRSAAAAGGCDGRSTVRRGVSRFF